MLMLGQIEDQPTAAQVILENQRAILAQLEEIRASRSRDAQIRAYALIIGAVGALFAAVRLGIIAFPIVREKRAARRQPR